MRIRWRNFELPSKVQLERQSATPTYGKFMVEPFERGFGTTIGNGLRRTGLTPDHLTVVGLLVAGADVGHQPPRLERRGGIGRRRA
mgnify:CR=1 FL=1